MFEALSMSAFAQWVTVSRWAYPTFLTAHGLGMAVVVGLTVMIGLRVFGFPKEVPLAAYCKTVPLGIAAFVVNAASGTALFVADASTLSRNPSFIIKIIAIVVGLIVLRAFYKGPLKAAQRQALAGGGEYQPSQSDKVLAAVAIAIWLVAVIVSGRLIAYLAPEF
jgi:hypothetical protein